MIEFRNVSKKYNSSDNAAIHNATFKINKGEFAFLVGSSGSGKSTMIKLILKEEEPTSGKIIINGKDTTFLKKSRVPYLRRSMGVVFQDFRLLPDKTVYDNVAYINFIKVKDTERRKGIASELIKSLQKEYKNINWGFTTEDGTALRKSLDETLRRVKKDIYATYNVNDVIDLLKDTDHDWRLMYDDHEKLWLLGDANGVIHFDMLESAWDQGYFDDNMDWIYEYVGADTDSYRDIAEDGFYLNEDEPNEEWVDPWLYSLLYVVDNDDSFYQQDGFVHNAMTTLGGRLYARDNYSLEETPLSSICI